MTDLRAATFAVMILAAVTAVMVTRRRPGHVPAAVALVVLAVVTLARVPIYAALGPPSVEPYTGAARVLVYVDGAMVLAAASVTPGLALAVAVPAERSRFAVAVVTGVWLVASVVLAVLYPSPLVRGEGLQRIYLAADLIGLFVSAIALISESRRGIAAKKSPGSASMVAIGLVLLDVAILLTPLSPWRGSVFGASFDGVQVEIIVVFAAMSAAQGILWRFSTE